MDSYTRRACLDTVHAPKLVMPPISVDKVRERRRPRLRPNFLEETTLRPGEYQASRASRAVYERDQGRLLQLTSRPRALYQCASLVREHGLNAVDLAAVLPKSRLSNMQLFPVLVAALSCRRPAAQPSRVPMYHRDTRTRFRDPDFLRE